MAWRETVVISRNFDARESPRASGWAQATFEQLAPAPVVIPVREPSVPEQSKFRSADCLLLTCYCEKLAEWTKLEHAILNPIHPGERDVD
jgi:hypothetical protein